MTEFTPIIRKAGEVIRSEDWNSIQEGLLAEIMTLEQKIGSLKNYIENMSERITLTGLESAAGRSFGLDEEVPGEAANYRVKAMGMITRQWVTSVIGEGDICHFGITDYFDVLYFWAGAENGNQNMLDIELEYADDTIAKVLENGFVNDKNTLSEASEANPYIEFLYSDFGIWYKYQVKNPHPDIQIRYIRFRNTNPESNPRIGNTIQLKTRVHQLAS
jgi:hypothetical protein